MPLRAELWVVSGHVSCMGVCLSPISKQFFVCRAPVCRSAVQVPVTVREYAQVHSGICGMPVLSALRKLKQACLGLSSCLAVW